MDEKSVNWDKGRFDEIKGEVDKMLTKIGYKTKKIEGKTLYDALELVAKPPKRDKKKPFRMPVSGVYKIKGVGDVITGRIEQGQLKPNETVGFAPTGVAGKAFSIEMHHKSVAKAGPG